MIKQRKKKVGFTLVEVILSVAIILMIGGVIAGVCVSISDSFITTYNVDDSADYAMLYAKGFENSFLKYTQVSENNAGKTCSWYMSNPEQDSTTVPLLQRKDGDGVVSSVFEPNFMSASGTKPKWVVAMFYYYESDKAMVNYRIFIKDNYSDTDFIYRYDGSFWVPRYEERAKMAGVESQRCIDSTVGRTLDSDGLEYYGIDADTIPSDWLDGNYTDQIDYTWG